MADTSVKLSGTYDSIEAYNILEEMRNMSSDYEEIRTEAAAAASAATAANTAATNAVNTANTAVANAQTYAGNANTSAGEAAGYASDASTAANNAASSETNAHNSEVAAAASASSAAASEAVVAGALPLSGGTITGNLEVNGNLTQAGHNVLTDATVGTVVSNSSNAISLASSTAKTLTSVVLPAGVWVVVGKSQINVNHNGNYGIILAEAGDAFAFDSDGVYADTCTNGGIFAGTVTKIFKLTTQKTIYLNAYTGGGATATLHNFISAVRIA